MADELQIKHKPSRKTQLNTIKQTNLSVFKKILLNTSSLYFEVFIMPLWFLSESGHSCGIWWNLVELFLAESPAKIAIPGTIYSGGIEPFWNWHWNGPGMDRNGIRQNAVFFFFFFACMIKYQ